MLQIEARVQVRLVALIIVTHLNEDSTNDHSENEKNQSDQHSDDNGNGRCDHSNSSVFE